jgi:hypothetical protein
MFAKMTRSPLLEGARKRLGSKTIFVTVLVLSTIVTSLHGGRLNLVGSDVPQYLDAAYHVFNHSTFSEEPTAGVVAPAVGREPGQAVLLATLMAVDPAFARFKPKCLDDAACDPGIYRIASLANLVLLTMTGITMALVGRMVLRSGAMGVVCGAYLLLNQQLNKGWVDPMSDRLAMWLVSLSMLAIAWAWRSDRAWPWSLVGLALAGLTLTKAIFLPCAIAIASCVVVLGLVGRVPRKRVVAALAAAAIVYVTLVGGWMLRNDFVAGEFRLTDARSGVALNARAVFDDMTPEQYAIAFVYWTRGPGNAIARHLFGSAAVAPFELEQPGGFYDRGQNGYATRVAEVMRTGGVDRRQATGIVDRQIIGDIMARPLTHVLATLPLFYRGIWIDEFIVLGLPALFLALWLALRDRDGLRLILLSIGVFNLVFYPIVSLNIPRYQMTAMPAVALAVACAAQTIIAALARRRAAHAHLAAPGA